MSKPDPNHATQELADEVDACIGAPVPDEWKSLPLVEVYPWMATLKCLDCSTRTPIDEVHVVELVGPYGGPFEAKLCGSCASLRNA